MEDAWRALMRTVRLRDHVEKILTAGLGLLLTGICSAEPATLYSYDSHNHLMQATVTTGAGIRYQYDLTGNLTSTDLLQSAELTSGSNTQPDLQSGQVGVMSFYADGTHTVTLIFDGILTTPTGVQIVFNVYDSSGSLVATVIGTDSATLALPGLSAGTYHVVATPQNGASAGFHVNASGNGTAPASDDEASSGGDAPLPTWALAILGLLLFAAIQRVRMPKPVR